jgi:hypothetical protein
VSPSSLSFLHHSSSLPRSRSVAAPKKPVRAPLSHLDLLLHHFSRLFKPLSEFLISLASFQSLSRQVSCIGVAAVPPLCAAAGPHVVVRSRPLCNERPSPNLGVQLSSTSQPQSAAVVCLKEHCSFKYHRNALPPLNNLTNKSWFSRFKPWLLRFFQSRSIHAVLRYEPSVYMCN